MRATNINWDTDGEKIGHLPTELELPDEITEETAADYLSDRYGWCINSLDVV